MHTKERDYTMKITKKEIIVKLNGRGNPTVIPKGTGVVPATNLPKPTTFWVEPWDDMTELEESWMRNYGFLVTKNQVEDFDLELPSMEDS